MSERSQKLFLMDILESIDAIASYVDGCSFEFFCADRKNLFRLTIRETGNNWRGNTEYF